MRAKATSSPAMARVMSARWASISIVMDSAIMPYRCRGEAIRFGRPSWRGHEESRPGESRTGSSAVMASRSVHVLQRRDHEIIGQLHARGVVGAIAARVLVEVLLVVVLGVIER